MASEPKRGWVCKQTTIRDPDGSLHSAMQIECRKCENIETAKVSGNMRALGEPQARKIFQQRGWDVRSNYAICPDCKKHQQHGVLKPEPAPMVLSIVPMMTPTLPKEEPMAEPVPITTTRTITRDDKRKINAEIAGNWDDELHRYIGDASDQSIANDLKVPRKWVEDIRIEFYGDDGSNSDITSLKTELDIHIADVEKLVTVGLENVSKVDAKLKELKGIRERLERIEKSVLPRR